VQIDFLVTRKIRLPRFYESFIAHLSKSGLMNTGVIRTPKGEITMGILRTGLAGAGAWKWGGGLFGTIIVFVLLYWLLGAFGMQ